MISLSIFACSPLQQAHTCRQYAMCDLMQVLFTCVRAHIFSEPLMLRRTANLRDILAWVALAYSRQSSSVLRMTLKIFIEDTQFNTQSSKRSRLHWALSQAFRLLRTITIAAHITGLRCMQLLTLADDVKQALHRQRRLSYRCDIWEKHHHIICVCYYAVRRWSWEEVVDL